MAVLTLDRVRKDYGTKPLLDEVSLVVEADEKLGVIGANGAGKTTLLRIASGAEAADRGRVVVAPGARVGFLPQRPHFDEAQTVLDAVFAGDGPTATLLRDYEAAVTRLERAPDDPEAAAAMTRLAARLDAVGGWDHEAQARATLDRLGVTDLGATVGTLSGGQRKRVALARVLVERPDLLVLDEPTNHLDAETVGWLEGLLRAWTGALLLVTHDRYLLDRVTNRMLEVGGGEVTRYVGTYGDYMEQKEAQEAVEAANEARRANLARRELAWLRRGAKARTSKSKSRIDRAHALLDAAPGGPEAEIEIASVSSRLGKKVIEAEGVTKAYGDRVLIRDFTYALRRDDRLGVIGPNGAGKTTLLEMLAGRLAPDAGRIERGPTVSIGYYDQESRALAAADAEGSEQRILDYVEEIAENVKTADGSLITASQMLERFLFSPKQQRTPVGLLSGGERRRLYLLRVLMGAPNVLLLDEPTNDLDIATLVALEDYLDTFAGAVVTVSHDRYFLDRTAEHLFRFEAGGRLREIPGTYSAWLEIQAREEAAAAREEAARKAAPPAPAAAASEPAPRRSDGPKKLSYNEKRELETLEARIAEAEARQPDLEAQLAEHATDADKVMTLSAELAALVEQLDADVDRWAELAERA
ncbi:MAG: ABC-F family ATP-binding cassette domain-containing protein [Bacteroidota bacterium]